MTTNTASPEALAFYRQVRNALLPAVLKDTRANGVKLAAHIETNSLPHTAENYVLAASILYRELQWVVKPAVLVRDEENERLHVQEPQQKTDEKFIQKVRASETADAKAADDKRNIVNAKSLVAAFLPVRDGKICYGQQAATQKTLSDYIARESGKKNANTAGILQKVRDYISDQYSKAETGRERL
jgi:hypothetical protein